MPWTFSRQPCKRCGGPKQSGRGRGYCDTCAPLTKYRPRSSTPCRRCGSRENKLRNKQLCEDCRELAAWRKRVRKRATERKPCEACGRPKGEGAKRRLCDTCRAARQAPRSCSTCSEHPVRGPGKRLCVDCHRESVVRHRQRATERARERERERVRREGRKPRKYSERSRTARLEGRRIAHRLRAERKGRIVTGAHRVHEDRSKGVTLPGQPLASAMRAYEERQRRGNSNLFAPDLGADTGELGAVYERVGVAERVARRWARGLGVSLSAADLVLTRLGLAWWEVWSEETVRLPIFVVGVYGPRITKRRNGTRRIVRERARLIPYGDLGPDQEELRRIEALMTGEEMAA
jgi:hypothetical protein